ncbi:hypothetical protein LR392_04195 [Arthrobacter sp. AK04]|uniref:hypothetical protein n=1 Tax=Arthrobacter sp. AK04 TaxID=2900048 RepID=UPI001E39B3B1|nr:hypothetical protein [Arthrobacter sp. AK04]MCD5341429.1 hypothetical protein [Arthrobacter sp. AK04]
MISPEVQAAVATLQQQADVARKSRDSFELDRVERALDELVRNHTKTGKPSRMIRSARANAYKVLKDRASFNAFSLDAPELHTEARSKAEASAYDAYAEFELLDWLAHTSTLNTEQRVLLTAVAHGHDVTSLALVTGVPLQRMRERLSRARRAAFNGYALEVECI